MENEETTNPVAEQPAPEQEVEQQDIQEETEGEQPAPEDDSEEVDYEGQKYKVPKALKDALLRHSDYTRKTQEVAEMRREAEAERARFLAANQEQVRVAAQVTALDAQLQQFQQLDWQQLSEQDPAQAQKLWIQFSQLKETRQQTVGQLAAIEQQRAIEAQRNIARQVEEGQKVLAREIPGWGQETAKQLREFASKELGFRPEELAQIYDPRVVKLLHAAYVGSRLTKQATAQPSENVQVKPVTKVGAAAPAKKDPERMSIDDWMRERNKQARKRA